MMMMRCDAMRCDAGPCRTARGLLSLSGQSCRPRAGTGRLSEVTCLRRRLQAGVRPCWRLEVLNLLRSGESSAVPLVPLDDVVVCWPGADRLTTNLSTISVLASQIVAVQTSDETRKALLISVH